MNQQQNRAEELAQKYWSATLTSLEEQELRELLTSLENPNQELATLKVMLSGFEQLAQEYEKETEANQTTIARKATWVNVKIFKLASGLTAAAAMIAIALVIHLSPTPTTTEEEIYCYINGEPITDIEVAMEQMKYLNSLASLNKSIAMLESLKTN